MRVSPLDLCMLTTTLPAILTVAIVRHVALVWRQQVPKPKCAPCPEFDVDPAVAARVRVYCALSMERYGSKPSVSPASVDPAVIARVRAYCALSMVERYGAHGPP
jgi:hypothetical protein